MSLPTAVTPIDLQNYAAWKNQEIARERTAASQVAITRRTPISLSLTLGQAAAPAYADGESDADGSPLDVPAFLRRQSEAG